MGLSQEMFTFNCQNRAHSVNVVILNDILFELNETVFLQLVQLIQQVMEPQSPSPSPSPFLTLEPSRFEIVIIDEDRKNLI